MSSFKSNENIHKEEDGSYYVVSAKASSVRILGFIRFPLMLSVVCDLLIQQCNPENTVQIAFCHTLFNEMSLLSILLISYLLLSLLLKHLFPNYRLHPDNFIQQKDP